MGYSKSKQFFLLFHKNRHNSLFQQKVELFRIVIQKLIKNCCDVFPFKAH